MIDYLLPKMLVAGVVSVSLTSVILGGLLIRFCFKHVQYKSTLL